MRHCTRAKIVERNLTTGISTAARIDQLISQNMRNVRMDDRVHVKLNDHLKIEIYRDGLRCYNSAKRSTGRPF